MHDAANDILSQAGHHSFTRGLYGLLLGVVCLFSELQKGAFNHSQIAIDAAEKQGAVIVAQVGLHVGSVPFTDITTVGAFILIVFNIFRFLVDMHDRFKPTKKRGARPMPGDSGNPKLLKMVVNAAKAVIAPAKNPSTSLAIVAFIFALASTFIVIVCLAAPASQHIERDIEFGFLFIAAISWLITFKHTRGKDSASNNPK